LIAGESDVAAVRQIFGDRHYDIGSTPAIGARLNARYRAILQAGRKPAIVDAGANIGAAALWFRKTYVEAGIVAVESEPANIRILKRNLAGRRDMIVLAAAIGGRSGFVEVKKDALSWAAHTLRSESGVPIVTDGGRVMAFPLSRRSTLRGLRAICFPLMFQGGNVNSARNLPYGDHFSLVIGIASSTVDQVRF
jgi:hypothetical protein